eukprot:6153423-Prymnesium_polylepis.1
MAGMAGKGRETWQLGTWRARRSLCGRPVRDGVADGDGGRRHDRGEEDAEDAAAAAAERRVQREAELWVLMCGRASCARR